MSVSVVVCNRMKQPQLSSIRECTLVTSSHFAHNSEVHVSYIHVRMHNIHTSVPVYYSMVCSTIM